MRRIALSIVAVAALLPACPRKSPPPPDAGTTAAPASPGPSSDEPVPRKRLPDDVTPLRYRLALTIDPAKPRFGGRVEIDVRLAKARRWIWLHGRDLTIRAASARTKAGPVAAGWTLRHEDGIARLSLAKELGPGEATLVFDYDAPLNKSGVGLFQVEEGGAAYAFTQFEAIDARRAFPSFDEPGFKTPFELSLTVPKALVAIANTSALSDAPVGVAQRRVTFAPTEKLPTYLVAFAVGPLEVVDAPPLQPTKLRPRPLPLRGVAVKGKGARLAYALSRAPALIATLETYFGVGYPYDKLDLIAVPTQTGAMENAGAITFEEDGLLVRRETLSAGQARRVAGGMAHEIAHHWFGDLVTMKWWDDLWLNEAFATWMGTRAHDLWQPAHRPWLRLWEWVEDGMRLDATRAARRIRQPIESTHDIEGAFDDITYGKGARVLSMFERYLGADAFRRGVTSHMDRFRFGSATVHDFVASLTKASGKDVSASLRSFLDQPGVPLVEAKVRCEGEKARLEVRQSRYLPLGSEAERKVVWHLPLCVRYGRGDGVHEQCALVSTASARIPLEKAGCPEWLHPNADGAGYYRFALDAPAVDSLLRAFSRLTLRERLSFADALLVGHERGALPFDVLAPALERLARSTERGLLRAPMELLAHLCNDVVPELAAKVRAYARRLYGPHLERLGLDGAEDVEDEARLFRQDLVRFLALEARAPELRRKLLARALPYLGLRPTKQVAATILEPALLETALGVAVEEGGGKVVDALLARLTVSNDSTERLRLTRALARVTEPALAEKVHAAVLSPSFPSGDFQHFLRAHPAVAANRDAAWRWLTTRYDAIVARLPPSLFGAGELPRRFQSDCRAADAERLVAFFAARAGKLPGGPNSLAVAEEWIRRCARAADVGRPSARAFFETIDPRTGARLR